MVEATCLAHDGEQCLDLFVLAHPVGTPFPGGFEVRNGEYVCPVRERADDVEKPLLPGKTE